MPTRELDQRPRPACNEGDIVQSTAAPTVLAYKGLDGVPSWLVFGIVILAFIVLGVAQARKKQ
jgi:hypothetical protein